MPAPGQNKKEAEGALSIDAMQVGLEGHLDNAVLVTSDGDIIPLVRALMK